MKKPFLFAALLCAISIATVLSCKKHSNDTTPSGSSLNQLFAAFRYTPQSLRVTAGRDTVIFGAKGTMLHFYVNSFKDASGTTLTSGTVNLQIVEMYKPGDMISNRSTTLASGNILQSKGEINIIATMSGKTVYTNGYGIGFAQATGSAQKMSLFYGGTANFDSVNTWTVVDTLQDKNNAYGTINDTGTTGPGGSAYSFQGFVFDTCTNLNSINCDGFYSNDSPKTTVSIVMPDTSFNPTNTQIYIVFPTINSVMSNVLVSAGGYASANWNSATHTISMMSEGNSSIVPTGLNYELVVITCKNNNYYYFSTSGTTTMGLSVNASMVVDAQSDIATKLSML